MMRRRSIILAILAAASLHAAQAQAQVRHDHEQCRDLESLMREYAETFETPFWINLRGRDFARDMSKLIRDSAIGREAVGRTTMRMFAAKYGLPPEFDALVAAENHEEFWSRAELILDARNEELRSQHVAAVRRRIVELEDELRGVDCSGDPPSPPRTDRPPPVSPAGPLPVGHYPAGHPFAGNPIMTDDLISRWLKGSYAAAKSGGGYWLAASMTVQDFEAVKERINAFLYYSAPPSSEADLKAHFSAEELVALKAREKDLRNAWAGNWSEVERM
jgi:hypothetical protein